MFFLYNFKRMSNCVGMNFIQCKRYKQEDDNNIIYLTFHHNNIKDKKKIRFSLYFHILMFVDIEVYSFSLCHCTVCITLIKNNKLCYYVVCILTQQPVYQLNVFIRTPFVYIWIVDWTRLFIITRCYT